ncbi:MAG: hypothetical protein ACOX4F_01190 [Atopobiaceae bacterium]|jgi:hypothetical protein
MIVVVDEKSALASIERQSAEESLETLLNERSANLAAAHPACSEALNVHVLVHPIRNAELVGHRKVFLHEKPRETMIKA